MQEYENVVPPLDGRLGCCPADHMNMMNSAFDHGRKMFTGPSGYIGQSFSYTDLHVDATPAVNINIACGTPHGDTELSSLVVQYNAAR